MKKWIALLLALMMVMAMAACGAKEEAPAPNTNTDTNAPEVVEDEGEEESAVEAAPFDLQLAVDAVSYMYTPDFESVIGMMHPAIIALIPAEDLDVIIEDGNASIQTEIDAFVETYGEVELVFTAAEAYPIEDYIELVGDYVNCGMVVNGYMEVPVTITESSSGEEIDEYVLYFVEIDGEWYLHYGSLM